jgi:hypothetical protein
VFSKVRHDPALHPTLNKKPSSLKCIATLQELEILPTMSKLKQASISAEGVCAEYGKYL